MFILTKTILVVIVKVSFTKSCNIVVFGAFTLTETDAETETDKSVSRRSMNNLTQFYTSHFNRSRCQSRSLLMRTLP